VIRKLGSEIGRNWGQVFYFDILKIGSFFELTQNSKMRLGLINKNQNERSNLDVLEL